MSLHFTPVEIRFWPKVFKGSYCWQWMAAKMGRGYGKIWDGKKLEGAHRVSWILAHGPIPQGLDVLHTCDNPACVRPAHLFLGTDSDNRKDCIAKGRWWRDAKGEKCGNHKLTDEQIREIRRRHRPRGSTILAREFGVHPTTIQRIIACKTWDHIQS